MAKINKYILTTALVAAVLLASLTLFGFAGFFVHSEPISQRTQLLSNFSDADYTIWFAKDSMVQDGETQFQIYSVRSDGSNVQYETTMPTATWEQQLGENRIIESMGNYFGQMETPDGNKRLNIKTGIAGWFSYFTAPQIYLEKNNTDTLLWDTSVGELLWLPDSERITFTSDGTIYIMNTTSGEYASLVEGLGYIKIETYV